MILVKLLRHGMDPDCFKLLNKPLRARNATEEYWIFWSVGDRDASPYTPDGFVLRQGRTIDIAGDRHNIRPVKGSERFAQAADWKQGIPQVLRRE